MNIYNLRYFVTLARIRQYTKAAEELCITQPSLSHAISQMEKELGVKLFEKNGHKITLTQFGEEFLSYAEKTLDVLDDGIASIKRSAMGNGTIRLGFVRPLGISYVPRMAAAFIKKNPKLDIDFTFHTDVTGRLLDDMQLGKYDLLFCSKPSEEYHFTAEPVMKQRLVLITPKGKETEVMLEKAKADIATEKEKATEAAQADIARLALIAARKIVKTGDAHDAGSSK